LAQVQTLNASTDKKFLYTIQSINAVKITTITMTVAMMRITTSKQTRQKWSNPKRNCFTRCSAKGQL